MSSKAKRVAEAVAAVGEERVNLAASYVVNLKDMSKEEVFAVWVRECCGRICGPDIREQRKSWMIYDIVGKHYGKVVASAVA